MGGVVCHTHTHTHNSCLTSLRHKPDWSGSNGSRREEKEQVEVLGVKSKSESPVYSIPEPQSKHHKDREIYGLNTETQLPARPVLICAKRPLFILDT